MGRIRTAQVVLEYQPLILKPPLPPENLYQSACARDRGTIDFWRATWLKNMQDNHDRFKCFADYSVGQLWGSKRYQPAICAGAGPSLKHNVKDLHDRGDITLVSCLHNFHYLEDNGIPADYYLTLDAGEVTVEEATEGGSRSPDEYWDLTKDRSLVAFIGTSPRLLEKWQGKIYFYNAPVPDKGFIDEIEKIEKFQVFISNGGNVLGACVYFSRVILGCHDTIFIGADFAFGYPDVSENDEIQSHFHSWPSKYDKTMGAVQKVVDVFGNKVYTWPSYYSFAAYFNWLSVTIPGNYINATEGGCMGAFPEGNSASFKYMSLKKALEEFHIFRDIEACCKDPNINERKIVY